METPQPLTEVVADLAPADERGRAFIDAFTAFFARDDAGFDEAMARFDRAHDARVSA